MANKQIKPGLKQTRSSWPKQDSKPVSLQNQKQNIDELKGKIAEVLKHSPNAVDKAAKILEDWVHRSTSKRKKAA